LWIALRSSVTKALVRWESFPHGRSLLVTDAATITTEGEGTCIWRLLQSVKYLCQQLLFDIVLGQLPLNHPCRRRGTRRWLDGRILTVASGKTHWNYGE
jgi:hypothetical protein